MGLVSDIGTRISAELSRAEQAIAPRLEGALAVRYEAMRCELSDILREEFEIRFHESMNEAKRQFSEKLQEASATLEEERNKLNEEIAAARNRTRELSEELTIKQSELERLSREAASMIDDPDVELSRLIRHNSMVNDVKAYIRGLQFQSGDLSNGHGQRPSIHGES